MRFQHLLDLNSEGNFYIQPLNDEWETAFNSVLVDRAVKFQDIVFIPNRTLEVSPRIVDGVERFFLGLNSVEIAEVALQNDYKSPYILEVLDRGTLC